ncbi:ABC transporter substrate-binding protein [Schwartzia succinivorans]|jgi:iron complex transport system substrate-binding protein|uniref:Iron complex transport system substrate-binding protein n=1 Tax=Schwartzia succinivorans DSM 10502 TaxID=1123243 RepID=A0A1M5AY38_9FIRM|nr:ABC transporter substrate-binding protein [Schwartzia succinivorans]MBE6098181.1 ABC transporter substrate-binding protein [Schwartzia succinivorans]MBQ1918527.1 ABC transporter substrate-binding protein [Schwartzia sp. (in: firmicutes)]SHF35201.1 iron complex transport system substrate-binding protein [Schwartzia succinivorans DSM 10502]
MGKKTIVLIISIMLAAVLAGCGARKQAEAPAGDVFAEITDVNGRTVKLKKKPERIIVTSSSFLEPLHEVGGDVVARPDSKTNMPEYAKDKPSIGRTYNVDMEKLISYTPDLVIINKATNEKLIQPLEAAGIPVIVAKLKSYEDVKNGLRQFAVITGHPEKAEAFIADMDKRIEEIKNRLPKKELRVLILHSTSQGVSVQLDSSIAGSVANLLGFKNVASGMKAMEDKPDAAPYSIETAVEQNPDVIFVTSMGKVDEIKASMEKTMETNPAWQSIPAVRDKKVYYLSQEHFLLSPCIHYPEAVEEMARLIYPEGFK